jgi:hypothetical protein
MIIVAGGDSFIFGSELKSPDNTFTALLSKEYDYTCVAWPGIGNDGIARRVISEVEAMYPEKPIVMVNWTFPDRYEFKFTYDTGQKTKEWYSITPWSIVDDVNTIKKEFVTDDEFILKQHIDHLNKSKKYGIQSFAKEFYKHVGGGEYWEVYSSLKEIVYLQNYLKINNIPYLFTCADNSILYNYTVRHADSTIHSLTGPIYRDQENWFWFPKGTGYNQTKEPRGFYQWAVESNYPIGTTHPLEEAHLAAAELIKEKFNELVKKSFLQN